jgi:hypothetical protein
MDKNHTDAVEAARAESRKRREIWEGRVDEPCEGADTVTPTDTFGRPVGTYRTFGGAR